MSQTQDHADGPLGAPPPTPPGGDAGGPPGERRSMSLAVRSRILLILTMFLSIGFGWYVLEGRHCTTEACLNDLRVEQTRLDREWAQTAGQDDRPAQPMHGPSRDTPPTFDEKSPEWLWFGIDFMQDVTMPLFFGADYFKRTFDETRSGGVKGLVANRAFDLFAIQIFFLAVFHLSRRITRRTEGAFASWPEESHYYLGFLFTLLSLGFGLSDVDLSAALDADAARVVNQHIASIVNNTAAAMTSTVVGVFIFFCYSRMGEHSPETDRYERPRSVWGLVIKELLFLLFVAPFIALWRCLVWLFTRPAALYSGGKALLMRGIGLVHDGLGAIIRRAGRHGGGDDPNGDGPDGGNGNGGPGPDGPAPPGDDAPRTAAEEVATTAEPVHPRRGTRRDGWFKHPMDGARRLNLRDAQALGRAVLDSFRRSR